MKIAGCPKLSLHPLTGDWFRALNLKHWKRRLQTDHTRTTRTLSFIMNLQGRQSD